MQNTGFAYNNPDTPKTAAIRHKVNGLITRSFCAECLPLARAVNYGCNSLDTVSGVRYGSRFLLGFITEK